MTAISIEDNKCKTLKKETLMFDQNFLKEFAVKYTNIKKRYTPVIVVGICLIAAGGIPLLLERKNITSGVLVPYYPICVALIAVGIYIFIRIAAILEAYKLLVENEEHSNRLFFKLKQKVRKKVNDF